MEINELNECLKNCDPDALAIETQGWQVAFKNHVEELGAQYLSMSNREVFTNLISVKNYRTRRLHTNCEQLGVWVKIGDICYIDYGANYINEAGYQHFGLIVAMNNKKACVIPMTSNERVCKEALHNAKHHLFYLGKIEGMAKVSALFLNDMRYINTARIIDVKAHINCDDELFKRIKKAVIMSLK